MMLISFQSHISLMESYLDPLDLGDRILFCFFIFSTRGVPGSHELRNSEEIDLVTFHVRDV